MPRGCRNGGAPSRRLGGVPNGGKVEGLTTSSTSKTQVRKSEFIGAHRSSICLTPLLPPLTLSSAFVPLPEHTIRTTWDVRKHGV